MNKKRLYKITLWFFSILLALMLIASAVLYSLKDKMIPFLVQEINKEINVQVKVKNIDLTFWFTFPKVAIDFNEVLIYDSFSEKDKPETADTLLYSDQIRLKFNAMDLYNGKYEVQEIDVKPGVLKLKIDSLGRDNFQVLKEKKSEPSEFKLSLDQVKIHQMQFSYQDFSTKQFYYTYIKNLDLTGSFTEKIFTLHAQSALNINKIQNHELVLLKDVPAKFNLNLLVNTEKSHIDIAETSVEIAQLPFHLSAKYTPEEFQLKLHSKDLNLAQLLQKVRTEQTESLQKMKSKGRLNFDLFFQSYLKRTEAPTIDCTFKIEKASLTEPSQNIRVDDINILGKYHSSKDKSTDHLSLEKLEFRSIGSGFKGNLNIRNFARPVITCKGKGSIDLGVLQKLFQFQNIKDLRGSIYVDGNLQMTQSGEGVELNDFSANLTISDVLLALKEDSRIYQNIQGTVIANQQTMQFQDFKIRAKNSDFSMSGKIGNIYNHLKKSEALNSQFTLYSSYINLGDLVNSHAVPSTGTTPVLAVQKSHLFPDYITSSIALKIDHFQVDDQSFKAIKGDVSYANRQLTSPNLQLENSNSTVLANLKITEKSPEILDISTQARTENMDLKNLFKNWKSFDQDMITDKNIQGKAKVNLDFRALFDLDKGIDKNSIVAKIDLKITDGRLKNVETLQSISENLSGASARLVFKKQDVAVLESKLKDIQFSELSNQILIQNQKIVFPKMEIKSNLLDIYVRGTQNFDSYMDYHFDFKLRDLKTNTKDSQFGEVVDDGTGIRLFLHLFGTSEKLNFKWDKEANKEQTKENIQKAKTDALSILKTEFGINKKDTSIKKYVPEKKVKEVITIGFDEEKEPKKEDLEPKKNSKMQEKLNRLKQQNAKPKEEFTLE